MTVQQKTCGAQHPDHPDLRCERTTCVEYHRNGTTIWTQGAQPMPSSKTDPVGVLGVVRRTKAKARRTDPETSHTAAASVGDLTALQRTVYRVLQRGPLTDEEVFARLQAEDDALSVSGARTRRSELVDVGLVRDSGLRRPTALGRPSIVWEVTSF